jgi:hypothetical protein
MNLGLPPPRRLPKPSPRSDKEFKDGFINDALPLYFASAEAAQKARHLFSESTYHVRALKYDDNVPEFTPNWLALIRARQRYSKATLMSLQRRSKRAVSITASLTPLFTIKGAGHFPWL